MFPIDEINGWGAQRVKYFHPHQRRVHRQHIGGRGTEGDRHHRLQLLQPDRPRRRAPPDHLQRIVQSVHLHRGHPYLYLRLVHHRQGHQLRHIRDAGLKDIHYICCALCRIYRDGLKGGPILQKLLKA